MTIPQILRPIATQLGSVREEVESQLSGIADAAIPAFRELTDKAVHQLFTVHGKFLRPSLVLFTAMALEEGDQPDHRDDHAGHLVKIATAVELIHSASLVHDDIIDRSDSRRGNPSVNAAFGNKTAVLVGDLLYDQAFMLLAGLSGVGHSAQIELFELFTTTTREMCLGEIYQDQVVADPGSVTFEQYLQVIDYKTASLMSCCCRAGAIAAGAEPDEIELLARFGHHLGRTYQLIDDVVDHDSVFFDRNVMLETARTEATLGDEALEVIGENEGTSRLSEITRTVIARSR